MYVKLGVYVPVTFVGKARACLQWQLQEWSRLWYYWGWWWKRIVYLQVYAEFCLRGISKSSLWDLKLLQGRTSQNRGSRSTFLWLKGDCLFISQYLRIHGLNSESVEPLRHCTAILLKLTRMNEISMNRILKTHEICPINFKPPQVYSKHIKVSLMQSGN